ncbi:MAG TPA: hypothetical protein VHU81_17400 [Thermoanaerobaculia bacterium]|jgi:tetratricopeptide (TPR) repeat protein|nr:hypothetical protein [Thermoanaerobaculia bacterium]
MVGLAPGGAVADLLDEVEEKPAPRQTPAGRIVPLRSPEDDYGRAVDNVLARLRPRIYMADREQAEAPALFAELERNPPQRRELMVRNSGRFRSFGLCRLMVRASMETSVRDRQAAEDWAKLTLEVLDRLDPVLTGARVIEDLRARTWGVLGNARRAASDLQSAETAFRNAEIHLRRGTGDRLEREYVLARKASLRRAQRRFDEAVNLARRATSICLASGEPVRAARSVVVWALTHKEAGEPEGALHLLAAAERLASSDSSDPYLALAVRHNRIACLADAGRALAARRLLVRSEALYKLRTGPLVDLRRVWLEARIAAGLDELEGASHGLVDAREGFLEHGNNYEAALVSLDLAYLQARLGNTLPAARLVREILPIFESAGVVRETLAARILLASLSGGRMLALRSS